MATATKEKVFEYSGADRRGNSTKGEIRATNSAAAKALLSKQGIIAKKVRPKAKPLFGASKKVTPQDIALFTRQLSTMMKAGVPLIQSFEIVAEGSDSAGVKELMTDVRDTVAGGESFANAIRKHPKYFDDLFCELIAAGEQSGALETMLDRVATYKEKSESLKKKIKKAMTYPIAVLVIAAIVTVVLLVKVVPQFATTFAGFGAELPAFTLFVLGLSETMQANWWKMLIGIGIIGLVFKEAKARSKVFADGVDKFILKIPVLGAIQEQSAIARFARTLSTTFAAGVPLVDALDSVAGASGNAVFRDASKQVKEDVSSGIALNVAMRQTDTFPSLAIQMTAIGEESGALDDMLDKVATFYEEAVDNLVDQLTALMEPFIMAVLGVLVGGLLIAMYLPIFSMGNAM
ncbi:type II secretion system F family protein [uncultured Umboniibacter sp.]|uniref:type II secretion system F family protein n=1 Tax=uncultured Umboniibacter sp. TaxID=1798917 RepID=UPI002608DD39|nr:type II secretion system F family protein [uncultured Umboniibacter sp.]